MLLPLLLLGVPQTVVQGRIADDLESIALEVVLTQAPGEVELVLVAEGARAVPDELSTVIETQSFPRRLSTGGFFDSTIRVDGKTCDPTFVELPDGARIARCPAGEKIEVTTTLRIPERYGAFGKLGRQLTLGAGWFPYLRSLGGGPQRGPLLVTLRGPAAAFIVGDRGFGPTPSGAPVVAHFESAGPIPLVVLPPFTRWVPLADGQARFVGQRSGREVLDVPKQELDALVRDGLLFLDEQGLKPGAPPVLVEAPLRRDLALAAEGLVLVSDRAFRLTPFERFLKFHRFPILRELYTSIMFDRLAADPDRALAADALGAWLRDLYVADRFGRAETAFDVLWLVAFIPAVDSMLYAPQIPFVGAYFRLIDETDPHRPDLLDAPSGRPRGKLLYEKLLDRIGAERLNELFAGVIEGRPFRAAIRAALEDDAEPFLATWIGPYPKVQYRLDGYGSRPEGQGYKAEVRLLRTGDVIAEPLTVRLEDEDGGERRIQAPASTEAIRTITATLAAPLVLVELDPDGRLAETPSALVPSPKFDNRSSARWRVLLNNFNLLLTPTAGQLETALDVGFSRVRDVRWRFAARGELAPNALSLSGRGLYYFGAPITPDRLSSYLGMTIEGAYLRPDYAGTLESSFAFSGGAYYGYDDRETSWLPDRGTAIRAGIGYDHTFGAIDPASGRTQDALSITARVLRSFRAGAQQLSLRAGASGFLSGNPRPQLLYPLGGRAALRGYVQGQDVYRYRGIVSAEWVHPLLPELSENVGQLVWASALDGALYADAAIVADDLDGIGDRSFRADVGYGFRIYLDYFGVRPGVMAIDIAIPLVDPATGRASVGPPSVYIDFAQSFLSF